MSLTQAYDIERYANTCAKQVGLRVKWEDVNSVPCTDGKTIFLPAVNAYTSAEEANKLMVWVKHETSHCAYSDFTALEEYMASGLYAHVWNLLEDHRIDELNDSMYDGDKAKSIKNNGVWEKFVRDMSKKDMHEISTTYLNPMWVWCVSIKEEFYGDMSGIKAAYDATLSEKGRTHLAALEAGDYGDVLRNIATIEDKYVGTRATGDLAKRIMLEVFGAKVEKIGKPTKGDEKGDGEGEEGDGDGKGEGEEVDGDGKSGESGEAGDGKDEGDIPDEVMTMPKDPMSPFTPHKEGKREAPRTFVKDTYSRTTYTPTPLGQTKVHDFDTGKSVNWSGFDGSCHDGVRESVLKNIGSEAGFANKVRTRLQVISRDRWEYGKKRGKLNPSALWRCTMTEARGYNERVFKKQQHNDTLDVAISILVDCSGSMSVGTKFSHAMAAAAMLNSSLGTVLNIPVEILGFTELSYMGDSPNTMFIFKGFQSKVGTEEFARRAGVVDKYLCDNVDGESILFAANRLLTRKEKRRILIVLSDGQPCGGPGKGSTIKHTRNVIKQVEASPIELIGVGIMYEDVKNYYKKWQMIERATDIEHALFTLIDKHIFN